MLQLDKFATKQSQLPIHPLSWSDLTMLSIIITTIPLMISSSTAKLDNPD